MELVESLLRFRIPCCVGVLPLKTKTTTIKQQVRHQVRRGTKTTVNEKPRLKACIDFASLLFVWFGGILFRFCRVYVFYVVSFVGGIAPRKSPDRRSVKNLLVCACPNNELLTFSNRLWRPDDLQSAIIVTAAAN